MNSKTTTKLITRNNKNNYETNRKFLLCCTKPPGTPLVAMNMNMNMNKDGSVRSVWGCADELKEPVFKYAAVGGEYESDDAEILKDGKRKKKKGGGKKLLRIFKAILFETSMAKKLKKRKLIKKQKQALKGATLQADPEKSESFNESSISQEIMGIGSGRIFSTTTSSSGFSSNSSGIASSSICSSSLSSNSKCSSNKSFSDRIKSFSDKTKSFSDRNKSFCDKTKLFLDRNKSFRLSTFERVVPMKEKQEENMQMQEHGKGCYGPNIGLCFILISLFVLVLWGKCCAIFCTSTWLFLVPRWAIAKNPSQNLVIHSPQLDSDYKKKIIIGGLLERHNSRNR